MSGRLYIGDPPFTILYNRNMKQQLPLPAFFLFYLLNNIIDLRRKQSDKFPVIFRLKAILIEE